MKSEVRDLSLYVHIPFCKAKCSYCDFLSFGGCDDSVQQQYVSALCKEIAAYEPMAKNYIVKTIFIGGGTPSYIDASFIQQIMQAVQTVFEVDEQAEITMEGNPDSLTPDKLRVYRKSGVNRLSIGLQSTNDDMLKVLGRVHNYEQFVTAYNSARMEGFDNINVDLMSGLPGETKESYVRTLDRVLELQPEHISAYSLIVEEGTPLCEDDSLLDLLPSEELDRDMYAETKRLLKNGGYERYEISNYAKSGYECRHNLVYWTGGEYLGVGLGASSYLTVSEGREKHRKVRFHGVENLNEYIGRFSHGFEIWEDELMECIGDYYQDIQILKRKDEMEEFMFLGLRCVHGVQKLEFEKRFGVTMEHVYENVITKYKNQGLLLEADGRVYLSDDGIDVSNVIMAEFML